MREGIDNMKRIDGKHAVLMLTLIVVLSSLFSSTPSKNVRGEEPYTGEDLARAILNTCYQDALLWSSYSDQDETGQHRQSKVCTSLGVLKPTNGTTFALLSTGVAGSVPVTTDRYNPGDERGTWFKGGQKGYPRDEVTLTMAVQVPPLITLVTYDVQFLSAEYPEYKDTLFNDKLTVTVNSPSQGVTTYTQDVDSGIFRLKAVELAGSGFDIFATSGNPSNLDIVTTVPGLGGDAGATLLYPAEHPVLGPETVIITINIKDVGDNLVDSAVFIDNISFDGKAQASITARKNAYSLDGTLIQDAECGDTIEYRIDIINGGEIEQKDNELEDILSDNITFAGNLTTEFGTAEYIADEHKIVWIGDIPTMKYNRIKFRVTINEGLVNGTVISNQGIVQWDSDNNGMLDEVTYTNYANVTVLVYQPPPSVTEDFSDDSSEGGATQSYQGRLWFETSEGTAISSFNVVTDYHYATLNSFKTKIRATDSPQYWKYMLSELESDIEWWEVWFACGNGSEAADLYLTFRNSNDKEITRIKFEYIKDGIQQLTNWSVALSYYDNGWKRLYSDFFNYYSDGYLFNGWYKLRIEKNGENAITYLLSRTGVGVIDTKTGGTLAAPFSDLATIEWSSTKNPVVCPFFFWDEHTIGLC